MKTKGIVIGAVVLLALFFGAVSLSNFRKSAPNFTVRHVNSVCSNAITTMTFEVTNHTANPYIFHPFELEIQNTNGWSEFQSFNKPGPRPNPTLSPWGHAFCTINVTNLPDKSVVRLSVRFQKTLLGAEGFVRRAQLTWERRGRPGSGLSLNPYDKNSHVFGFPTEGVSEEWVETNN
jgi:hypothetical protein